MLDDVNFLPEVSLLLDDSCNIELLFSFLLALPQNLKVSVMPFGLAAVEAQRCAASCKKVQLDPHAERNSYVFNIWVNLVFYD